MKYCKYCGAELDDDAIICSKCGKNLNEQTTQTIIVQAPAAEPEAKKNGCGVAGFVIGLISLVFCWLAIFLVYYVIPVPFIAFVLSLVGIIVGKKKQQKIGLGIAGLILSTLALIFVISWTGFVFNAI